MNLRSGRRRWAERHRCRVDGVRGHESLEIAISDRNGWRAQHQGLKYDERDDRGSDKRVGKFGFSFHYQ